MVFPYLSWVKAASAPFLFNQRQRFGLRPRLRRVNKTSAARQRGRRPLFFIEIIILSFPDIEIISQTKGCVIRMFRSLNLQVN